MENIILAPRWKRLIASMSDLSVALIVVLVSDVILRSLNLSSIKESHVGVLPFAALILSQVILLGYTGQTIGKRIWKIKIVDKDSFKNAGFTRNTFTRGFLYAFSITIIVPIVDALWIFKKEKRCLHDLVAGTVVIKS